MRKFKQGDEIYRPINPELVVYVTDVQEIHQHYVCFDKQHNLILVPFLSESLWEKVSDTKETTLLSRYEDLANDYLSEFVKQTGIEDDAPFWVGNDVGGCACVADYFVDYTTIRYVVDGKMSFEDFDEWYCYCNEVKMVDDSLFTPTLEQWCYGEFTRISDERLEYMKKLKKDFEQLVQEEKEKQNT